MTFTYDPTASPVSNITLVRFHTGDVDANAPRLDDETITMILNQNDSNIGQSVISAITAVMAQIAGDPNFTADWLTVDTKAAYETLEKLLKLKAREFGVTLTAYAATFKPVYRADSNQVSADYTNNVAALRSREWEAGY